MEWISIEHQLPPDVTDVLGFNPDRRLTNYAICHRLERDDGNIWSWNGTATHELMEGYCIKPTYWMPLPTPPNG